MTLNSTLPLKLKTINYNKSYERKKKKEFPKKIQIIETEVT